VFDERKPSKTNTYLAGNTELTNMIHKKIKMKINESITDINHVRNTGPKGKKSMTFGNQMVLYRKI
jgi:hypothetical protein